MKRITFVIVGLGFIGGSLAARIRKRFRSAHIVGVSRQRRKLVLAQKKKLIHQGFTQLPSALKDADFVFICTPVDTIPKFLSAIDRYAKPGTIVTDVGSTKGEIVRQADRLRLRKIHFIGSHPLAGSHLRGLEHARADLFDQAFVFITPTKKSNPRALRAISSFWKNLHMSVRVISPEAHDRIVSEISHLPHVVASVLVYVVAPESLQYAASGFWDTTRVAQGDPRLWIPIFLTNRGNLLRDLSHFEKVLRKLKVALKKGSPQLIRHLLNGASLKRSKLPRS